jgi:hypothetical protein
MKTNLMKTLLILLCCLTAISVEAQNTVTTVDIDIFANKEIENKINSYIKRELRDLKDVRIVDEKGRYTLKITAMQLERSDGKPLGIAISYMFCTNFTFDIFKQLKPYKLDQKLEMDMSLYDNQLCFKTGLNMVSGGSDDIKELCENIIIDFDAEHLESSRKSAARANKISKDILKELENKSLKLDQQNKVRKEPNEN